MPNPAPRSTTLLLAACYALAASSIALAVAVAPLAGLALAPRPALATLPVSLQVLGALSASFPASMLMARLGRRNGFLVGNAVGAMGAGAAMVGIYMGSFVLFCAGSAAMGMLNGFAQFYRFAAAEAAPDRPARAISYVLAGGVAAGFVGPGIAAATATEWPAAQFAASYAAVIGLYGIVGVLLLFVRLPVVHDAAGTVPARRLGAIVRDPRVALAAGAAMLAYGVMSLLMTATPLSMRAAGHSFGASAFVIQGHVIAMFAPSFVTGRLIERWGHGRIMAAGTAAFIAVAGVAAAGETVAHFWTALVLLGVGWNFLFVAGTALLAASHGAGERAKVQGLNDVVVFAMAAAGSFLAGFVVDKVGWSGLVTATAPVVVLGGALLLLAGRLVVVKDGRAAT